MDKYYSVSFSLFCFDIVMFIFSEWIILIYKREMNYFFLSIT